MSRPRSTHTLGRRGEDRAVAYLRTCGYQILERNFRCRLGELDIIAREGDTLAFVEVRTRSHGRQGSALEAVSPTKQRQVARVASYYLTSRRLEAATCRFDVVGITGEHVELVRDAFRLGL